jgi:hypothetical protein
VRDDHAEALGIDRLHHPRLLHDTSSPANHYSPFIYREYE